MLKRKRDVCYRRAITRWERCKYCARRVWTRIGKIGEKDGTSETKNLSRLTSLPAIPDPRYEWRCLVIGRESSRRYGIKDNHVCNEYEFRGEQRAKSAGFKSPAPCPMPSATQEGREDG